MHMKIKEKEKKYLCYHNFCFSLNHLTLHFKLSSMVKSDQLTSSENMVYQRIMRPVSSKVTEPLLKFD